MVSLRSKPTIDDPFRKNETVKATRDLPGVPAGTTGKVKVIDGFRWQRYWVFFDNGVHVGSVDDHDLVRPAHWDEFFVRQQERANAAASLAAATSESASGESAPASAEIDPNDPMAALLARVPPHLIERAASARQRLGVPKP